MYFGNIIDNHWNLVNIIDKQGNDTNYIAVRADFWSKESEQKFIELSKTKKIIGLSSYQCFPAKIINPYENRGPTLDNERFMIKYNNKIILWLHCFKDDTQFIHCSIPRILYSETDQYKQLNELKLRTNVIKKYDFFCSIQEGQWNDYIRNINIAIKWLNYMADIMGLSILVCGNNRAQFFSKRITCIDFQPWNKFIDYFSSCKYLFCASGQDASPRIIIEAIGMNIPVLLNENILGGWKYINNQTGILFNPNGNIHQIVSDFINYKFKPLQWLELNYNVDNNAIVLKNAINSLENLNYEDYFDAVIVINIEHRTDRYNEINEQLNKMKFNKSMVHFINAHEDKLCGYLGCVISHMTAILYAKKNNFKNVLILEDDFIFHLPKERFLYILNSVYNIKWDVFMLSTYHNESIATNIDFIYKIKYGTSAAGYIVNKNFYDIIYNNFYEGYILLLQEIKLKPNTKIIETKYAIDQYWFHIQNKYTFLISNPFIGYQSNSKSSILN